MQKAIGRLWTCTTLLASVCLTIFGLALSVLAAERIFPSYASVKPVLDGQKDRLPAELKNADEAKWNAWSRQQDKAIRARLEQGDLDSMVNLLLFGTSFTKQPRVRIASIAEASKAGIVRCARGRFSCGSAKSGRCATSGFYFYPMVFCRSVGVDPEAADGGPKTGVFIYSNIERVLQEERTLMERAAEAGKRLKGVTDPASRLDRASLFSDRGVSLDTSILPNFSIDQTLGDRKKRGVLREGQTARVAVIGPGLDFIDKNDESGYDYYPQQTLQPFALFDSTGAAGAGERRRLIDVDLRH